MSELTERRAAELCDRAIALALERGLRVAVAVVDSGGHLIGFRRMDGVAAGAAHVVPGKATSAALFGLPTSVLDRICRERPGFATAGVVAIEGGLPVLDGERLVGAIAVGGAAPEQDAALARDALDAA